MQSDHEPQDEPILVESKSKSGADAKILSKRQHCRLPSFSSWRKVDDWYDAASDNDLVVLKHLWAEPPVAFTDLHKVEFTSTLGVEAVPGPCTRRCSGRGRCWMASAGWLDTWCWAWRTLWSWTGCVCWFHRRRCPRFLRHVNENLRHKAWKNDNLVFQSNWGTT